MVHSWGAEKRERSNSMEDHGRSHTFPFKEDSPPPPEDVYLWGRMYKPNETIIDLRNKELSGLIPIDITRLIQLEWLDLSYNQLSEGALDNLHNIPSLEKIDMDHNRISGPIPSNLGRLSHLKNLDLSFNQLSGPLPHELSQLTKLEELILRNNEITGPIPIDFGALKHMAFLYLDHNKLTGTIPFSFKNLKDLQQIDLSHNDLTGEITTLFFGFSELEECDLSHNNFEGELYLNGKNLRTLFIESNVENTSPISHETPRQNQISRLIIMNKQNKELEIRNNVTPLDAIFVKTTLTQDTLIHMNALAFNERDTFKHINFGDFGRIIFQLSPAPSGGVMGQWPPFLTELGITNTSEIIYSVDDRNRRVFDFVNIDDDKIDTLKTLLSEAENAMDKRNAPALPSRQKSPKKALY